MNSDFFLGNSDFFFRNSRGIKVINLMVEGHQTLMPKGWVAVQGNSI